MATVDSYEIASHAAAKDAVVTHIPNILLS